MYLVVFRNRKRADLNRGAYAADAARMEALARAQPGFLAFKSYTAVVGEVIALSEWADESAARAWGRVEEHAGVQARGRAEYYSDDTLFACAEPRVRHFAGEAGE
jgi:heme-degrading monooxygenase HmoA